MLLSILTMLLNFIRKVISMIPLIINLIQISLTKCGVLFLFFFVLKKWEYSNHPVETVIAIKSKLATIRRALQFH